MPFGAKASDTGRRSPTWGFDMPRRDVLVPALLLALLVVQPGAVAHVNDRGMDYGGYKDHRGVPCCNHADCRPAADYVDTVVYGLGVVRLLIDGRWVSVSRYFMVAEDSTDGRAHWCGKMMSVGTAGERKPVPICIILPPKQM